MDKLLSSRYYDLLMNLADLVPGVRKVLLVIHGESETASVAAYSVDYPAVESSLRELDTRNVEKGLLAVMRKKESFEWMLEEEVLFEEKPKQSGQIDIFTAARKDVLLLRMKNRKSDEADLLYLYFSGISNDPGVKGIRKGLDEPARAFIGMMAWKTLHFLIEKQESQTRNRLVFHERTRESFELFRRERQEYIQTGKRYGESLLRLAEARLKEISQGKEREYVLSESASEKVKTYPGELAEMLKKIDQAVEYATELHLGSKSPQILIEDWYLELSPKKAAGVKERAHITDEAEHRGALTKSMELLDKLEHASRDVLSNGLKLTSANVGKMCPTPISAPAITDSIRNHRNRIVQLLRKYPDKWTVIREQFRPIINALEYKESPQRKASA